MSGFHVAPDALETYASGSQSLGEKFGALADLLEQARVDDQCFGPIGEAIGLANSYFNSLEECQKLATQAKAFLEQVQAGLQETAATYRGLDEGIAQAFTAIGDNMPGVNL
ncbi:MAG TPA: hypothetical protein VIL00_18625 [Pseudonocardiaceae bacterium]